MNRSKSEGNIFKTPLKPPHPTAKFLELYASLSRVWGPGVVKTPRKIIGTPKLFLFHIGLTEEYEHPGIALAIASTKEDACEYILNVIKERHRMSEFCCEFWKELNASYDFYFQNYEQATGLSFEEWSDMLPDSSKYGMGIINLESVEKELKDLTPDVIPLDTNYAYINAGLY